MRKNLIVLAILSMTVLCCSVGLAFDGIKDPWNIFPSVHYGLCDKVGMGSAEFDLFQGWCDGEVVWYILENGSNDINTNAWICYRTLFPKLGSAIDSGAAGDIYVVMNYNQGPVFSVCPPDEDYTPLWRVHYITWKPDVEKRTIIDAGDLPAPEEADIEQTDIVVDRPIVATGQLGGPWTPAPEGRYRLKQVLDYDPCDRDIRLPIWMVYGQSKITRYLLAGAIIIPDVGDSDLAELLQANYAPKLAEMPDSDTQRMWVFDWMQNPPPRPAQWPILEFFPNYGGNFGRLNDNYDFSPIMIFTLIERDALPPYVVVNNPFFLKNLLEGGGVSVVSEDVKVNAPLLFYFPWWCGPRD